MKGRKAAEEQGKKNRDLLSMLSEHGTKSSKSIEKYVKRTLKGRESTM
jgi:hypothetical protein